MSYAIERVTLIDEDGEEAAFVHLLTFNYEGERYVALEPEAPQDDVDEAEVVIMHIVKEEGTDDDVYVPVDNDILLDEVFERFLELMDELEEEN